MTYQSDLSVENKEDFLEELESGLQENEYPESNTELVYDMVEAYFVARQTDDLQFADELQTYLDEFLKPIQELRGIDGEEVKSDSELWSLALTSHGLSEFIGSWKEQDGEVVYLGHVANRFIYEDSYEDAVEALAQFESWYRDKLEGQENEDICVDIDGLVFNGMRQLMDRKDRADMYPNRRLKVP